MHLYIERPGNLKSKLQFIISLNVLIIATITFITRIDGPIPEEVADEVCQA